MENMPGEPAQFQYHVLLIGIDAYDGAGASLNGCVNDIDRIQQSLIERVGIGKDRITRLAAPLDDHTTGIPEQLPTLANLRAALEELTTDKVRPDDRVFIYYSGHGTQVPVKVEGSNDAPAVREAIVPTDRVNLGGRNRLLFDWEVNALLARIAARTNSVSVVLDCCCSAGATRGDLDSSGSRARFLPLAETYLLRSDEEPPSPTSLRGLADSIPASVSLCQVVAACRDDEKARESEGENGFAQGELTRAILDQLKELPNDVALQDLRWGRIWRAVVAQVAERNPAQHPWLSGGFARRVFGGPPEDGDTGYGVVRKGDSYALQVGTLSGVTEGAEVAVYGNGPAVFPKLGSDEDRAAQAGRLLRVTHAGPSSAEAAAIQEPFDLPPGARARLVNAAPAARLRVALVPHDASIASALSTSPFLVVAEAGMKGDVALEKRSDGAWAVTDDVFGTGEKPGEPTLAIIAPDRLNLATEVLEHYYWYSLPLRLAGNCLDLPKALRVKLLDCNQLPPLSPEDAQNPDKLPQEMPREVAAGDLAPYQLKAGDETSGGDRICMLVENTSDVNLDVTLIACATSGQVAVVAQARIPAHKKHGFWAGDNLGHPFRIWLRHGTDVGIDRIVAIGTTNAEASLWDVETKVTFAEILNPARGERELLEDREAPTAQTEQWTSTVTTYRAQR